jgi:SAM-dependent methyltransferase
MIKFSGFIDNSKDFWNVQYAPERREDYKNMVRSVNSISKFRKIGDYTRPKDRFLDLACGFGLGAIWVKDNVADTEVWGCDQSDVIINDLAKERRDIKFIVSSVGDSKIPSNYFDVIFAGDVVEHLEDPNTLFKDAFRMLKKDGIFIITTPDGDVRPYGASPDHVWLFTHDDIDAYYSNNGFDVPDYPYIEGKEGVMAIYAVGKKL